MIFIDRWSNITNTPTKQWCSGVATLDNKIYFTGGRWLNLYGDDQTLSSAICYDLDTNMWSQIANMNIERSGHSLVSLHGKLFAIGGEEVDSVEVYDPDNNTWALLQYRLDGTVYGTGAGLIKKYYVYKLRQF